MGVESAEVATEFERVTFVTGSGGRGFRGTRRGESEEEDEGAADDVIAVLLMTSSRGEEDVAGGTADMVMRGDDDALDDDLSFLGARRVASFFCDARKS